MHLNQTCLARWQDAVSVLQTAHNAKDKIIAYYFITSHTSEANEEDYETAAFEVLQLLDTWK